MTENFEYKGEWFLPSNKTEKVSGTLYYDVNKGITLELFGDFSEIPFMPISSNQEYDIILGLTSDSKEITLYKTFISGRSGIHLVQNQEAGMPSSTYIINYIFEGVHFDKIEDIKFDTLISEIMDLDEWVGISGFVNDFDITKEMEMFKNKEIQVNYKLPELITFPLTENLEGQFDFTINKPGMSWYQKEISLRQKTRFILKYNQEASLEILLDDLFKFQSFLVLALYEKTHPKNIFLYNKNLKKDYGQAGIVDREVKFYFHISERRRKNEKQKHFMEMLFYYRDIRDNFPTVIKNWYEKYPYFEPVYNLLFEHFYNDRRFSENTFLNLTQAMEAFHARRTNKSKVSFIKRITEIIEDCSCGIIDKMIEDKEQFTNNIKFSRNYYTHYSSNIEDRTLKGVDLFYLAQKMKIILVCAFLLNAGFDKTILNQMLDDKKYRFFYGLANWKL